MVWYIAWDGILHCGMGYYVGGILGVFHLGIPRMHALRCLS